MTQQSNTRWRCCSTAITLNGRGYRCRRPLRLYILCSYFVILPIYCGFRGFWLLDGPEFNIRFGFEIKTSLQEDVNKMETADKYTILLPTYNERENLPVVIWLIFKYMKER